MKTSKTILAIAIALASVTLAESALAGGGHSHSRVSVGIGFGVGGWGYPYGGYGYGWGGYPYAYGYGYPYYAAPVVVQQQPTYYVEQPVQRAPQQPAGYWYYCHDERAYYPYVKECPAGWQRVAPQPAN